MADAGETRKKMKERGEETDGGRSMAQGKVEMKAKRLKRRAAPHGEERHSKVGGSRTCAGQYTEYFCRGGSTLLTSSHAQDGKKEAFNEGYISGDTRERRGKVILKMKHRIGFRKESKEEFKMTNEKVSQRNLEDGRLGKTRGTINEDCNVGSRRQGDRKS